jgi:hypothetical protein
LLPPTKLYLARPVHRAAGAGNPAGSNGAKSKPVAVDMDTFPTVFVAKTALAILLFFSFC